MSPCVSVCTEGLYVTVCFSFNWKTTCPRVFQSELKDYMSSRVSVCTEKLHVTVCFSFKWKTTCPRVFHSELKDYMSSFVSVWTERLHVLVCFSLNWRTACLHEFQSDFIKCVTIPVCFSLNHDRLPVPVRFSLNQRTTGPCVFQSKLKNYMSLCAWVWTHEMQMPMRFGLDWSTTCPRQYI